MPSYSTARVQESTIIISSDDETDDMPSCSTARVQKRSRPEFIQPNEPKRVKTANSQFECMLYREKWHAIKASKAFFRDSTSVASLMLSTATKVNPGVPVACDDEFAFLVDTSSLEFDQDLTCDETGKYKKPSYSRCELAVDGEHNIFWLKMGPKTGTERYTLLRRYYPHRDTPGFFRTIYELQRDGVQKCPVVLIRYEWRGQKTALRMTVHGHCRQNDSPFIRSKKALIIELKKPSCQSAQDKLNEKFKMHVGSVGVVDAFSSLPRDRQQIYRHGTGGKKQTDFNKLIEKNASGEFVRRSIYVLKFTSKHTS
ncbi:uncharacterized protein LOC121411657 isoform X2 [Lytechinus variegatus]|uniref:uncharacterized protein LOC121411657 isoform X2 n=1 Tax=Lytechinus variegatus TaxID=7654 RepID=UPI001BB2BCDD|nr:uncharacterized protein LOC121411657 isoform X2 [Lytechinus variegatus]XP_041460674.1 uncharacterized protein LOC121411657 isoform X2 [Lytechinus variegatus]